MSLFDRLFATGLVLWFVSIYLFLVGHFGLLWGVFIVLPPAVALVVVAALLYPALPSLKDYGRWELLLLACTVAFVLLVLPLVSTPPVSRDALIHHLAVPKLYLEKGGIFEIPFMSFAYQPMNLDYLYLVPLYLGVDIAAKYIHASMGLLTAVLLYDFVKERASALYGLLAALLFLSTPVVVKLSASAYVDLGVTFYAALSVVAFVRWMEEGKKRYLFFSALAGGFSLGVKYNGAVVVFLLSMFVLLYSVRKKGQVAAIRDFGLYALVSSLPFLPYLVRNYLWVGNPFYPLIGGMVKGVEALHTGGTLSPVEKRYVLFGEDTLQILLVPFRMFFEGKDGSLQYFDGVLNPLFVALVPMLFLVRGKGQWFRYVAGFTVLYFYIAFFTTDLVVRYILPAFAGFIMLIAFAIKEGLARKYTKHVTVVLLVVMFLFNLSYVYGMYVKYRPFGFITGRETRDAYLMRMLPDYEAILWANRNLPADARVIFFFTGDRGYYWQRAYYYGGRLGGNLIRLVRESRTAEELKEKLLGAGFTHMFINNYLFERFSYDNFNAHQINLLSNFFRNHLKLLYTSRGFSLYEIVKSPD